MNSWKRYIEYVKDNPNGYWFKAKLYGVGWVPATREGWFVTLVAIGFVMWNSIRFELSGVPEDQVFMQVVAPSFAAIAILITICFRTGEPLRWNWGSSIERSGTRRTFKERMFIWSLRLVAKADTSADPAGWTKQNPLWGHCAVVALVAQDAFGGTIMRGSLERHAKYAHLKSHFWNRLPDGREVDFTAEQYTDLSITDLRGEIRDRARILKHPDTLRRYELLKKRFNFSSSNIRINS